MTDETQGASPVEDAPLSPTETPTAADSSPAQQPETPANDASPPPRDEDGKFLSQKAQKRIDELTWRANEREREAAYWREQAMRSQTIPEPAAPAAQPAKLPTLEEHGYDEAKYQAALIEYADKRAAETVEKRFAEYERQKSEQARVESFATRQQEFAKTVPDFEDKVLRDPTLPISATMRDVIIDSPNGPEMAYWLAENRSEAQKIAALPAHLAALELGRIEGRLEAQKAAKSAAKSVPPVSKAPPPPPTVEATEAAGPKPPEQMSDDEWYRSERRKSNLKQFRKKA
mgnify:CR=1 FL=1